MVSRHAHRAAPPKIPAVLPSAGDLETRSLAPPVPLLLWKSAMKLRDIAEQLGCRPVGDGEIEVGSAGKGA